MPPQPLPQWMHRARHRLDDGEDPAFAAHERARQIQAVMRITPLALLANVINVSLVGAALWSPAHESWLIGWSALVLLMCLLGMRAWWRTRGRPPRHQASARAVRRSVAHACVLSALWAAAPIVLLPGATPSQQLLLATVVTGMICAGGFALATAPWAGTAYVVILGSGSALALFRVPLEHRVEVGALLVIYSGIVLASVWSTARLFRARLLAEHQARGHHEAVSLLLRDFETLANDLLWELDATLSLRHASPTLQRLLRRERMANDTPDFPGLLRAAVPADCLDQLRALELGLAGREPMRELPLTTGQGSRRRWWSLSAKPLFDDEGRFDGWRGVATDISAQRLATQSLDQMAHTDALTGLPNRRALRQRMTQWLEEGPRRAPFSVMCLDLDGFKAINDTLGHATGDIVLQVVARRLRRLTPSQDLAGRLGGDEFAVLMAGKHDATQLEARVTSWLATLSRPVEIDGSTVAIRCSAGLASSPRDGDDLDSLLNRADLALYAAKSGERGRPFFFDAAMAGAARRRHEIEQGLRGALAKRELSLVYMPQVNSRNGRVSGFEALLRWQHPQLGAVPPAEFIPVAEAAGLIEELGAWVLRQACQDAIAWPADCHLAVNVSPRQVHSGRLDGQITEALAGAGLAPGRLEIEITESVLMNDQPAAARLLDHLRQRGVRVALDDFGTGYSALAYLRRFRFDTLKVHPSFTAELASRPDAKLILRMILRLAQALRMVTVVEGVEDHAVATVLRRLGCDRLQGFGLAMPLAAEDIDDFLGQWRPPRRSALAALGSGDTVPDALTD